MSLYCGTAVSLPYRDTVVSLPYLIPYREDCGSDLAGCILVWIVFAITVDSMHIMQNRVAKRIKAVQLEIGVRNSSIMQNRMKRHICSLETAVTEISPRGCMLQLMVIE